MKLEDLEKAYDFTYPALYKKLDADGMLNVGEYGPKWFEVVYPTLLENPPLLLHTYDFELLNVKDVGEAIAEMRDPDDYREIDPSFKFIPFAQSGAGDHYCFFLNEQIGDDIPIVFVWHDLNEVEYLAKNLREYIFRRILTDMSEQDIYNSVGDEEFMANLQAIVKSHGQYLPAGQLEVLQQMLKRPINDYQIPLPKGRPETRRGLLTDKELEQIFEQMVPFDKMGKAFPYSKE